jgi:competence protein ComGC
MLRQKYGFTVLEAVASVFIVSLVLITAMSIILTMRNHAIRTEEKIKATDLGSVIRYDLEHDYDYTVVLNWIDNQEQIVTNLNCDTSPIECSLFDQTVEEKDYSSLITIRFLAPTAESLNFKMIHFEITINYYQEQTVTLIGVIYETT